MEKYCKNCSQEFKARRKNHVYCCASCKTMASYKRNNYKYIPGHYQKDISVQTNSAIPLNSSSDILEENLSKVERKKEGVNFNSVSNAALGTAASDGITYGLKKMFAPNTLPATKGDIENLKKEINEIKKIINNNKNDFGVY